MPGRRVGRVLWVDEEIDGTLRFLKLDLEFRGYAIDAARSVAEFLNITKYHAPGQKPDVVILDVMMPLSDDEREACKEAVSLPPSSDTKDYRKTGIALVSVVKARLKDVPIIILTNLSQVNTVGAEVWEELRNDNSIRVIQEKPVSAQDLASLIEEVRRQG